MTEHTDKAPHKSGKAVPNKRPGRSRTPGKKRAKTSGDETASANPGASVATGDVAASKPAESKPLAPDPATITFGSNRPIVATPQKLPASSGLQFSGPSAGSLKASGPQPTSAKASGLTFTNAKPSSTLSKDPGPSTKDKSAKGVGNKAAGKKSKAEKPEIAKPAEAKAGADAKQKTKQAGTTEASKVPASGAPSTTPGSKTLDSKTAGAVKAPASTKPAIAPQASGRRLDKERSTSGFVATLVGLTVLVGGLTFWLNLGEQPAAPAEEAAVQPAMEPAPVEDVAATQTAKETAAIEDVATAQPFTEAVTAAPTPEANLAPAIRAPESPGPLVAARPANSDSGGAPPFAPPESEPGLTSAEIGEIQNLLERLELSPGATDGVLTGETTAAIRSYQEMAGLPADGAADKALLEELRAVVDLYGG